MILDVIERQISWVGIVAGLVILAIALWRGVWEGLRYPSGRTTGLAAKILRAPLQLLFGALWIGLCVILWKPVPVTLTFSARVAALSLGALFYFLGLALYLWGVRTLGEMYKTSSGFGVQLNVGHRLITHGPYAFVRHPLYLGLQIAAIGGMALFRTWTFVFVTVNFLALVIRAKREEQALAMEFGEQWVAYERRVPAWIPRFFRKDR
ncbi:isoprenylcysteine carboxylmethyltransferase family protein [Chloroflexi bacterium CFX2]|nr:isoprenylcysteine carboxylmethyltransferase family protein [Chloroflexi bacterium CFX2]